MKPYKTSSLPALTKEAENHDSNDIGLLLTVSIGQEVTNFLTAGHNKLFLTATISHEPSFRNNQQALF